MLCSVWTWWRIYSFLSLALLVSFGSGASTVLVINFLIGNDEVPQFAVVCMTVAALLVIPLLFAATLVAESLRTGETNALRRKHLCGAITTVALTLGTMLTATMVMKYRQADGNWALLAIPVFVWRARFLIAHPHTTAKATVTLWRHKVPPFKL